MTTNLQKLQVVLETILQDIFPSVGGVGHIEIGVRLKNDQIFGLICQSLIVCLFVCLFLLFYYYVVQWKILKNPFRVVFAYGAAHS